MNFEEQQTIRNINSEFLLNNRRILAIWFWWQTKIKFVNFPIK